MSTDNSGIIPERVSSRASGRSNSQRAASPELTVNSGMSIIWKLLIFVLFIGLGGAGYMLYQSQLQNELLSERIADIERKLSVTDESLSQSGAAIQALLKEHEGKIDVNKSEISKLWAIAHQRNTPNISANKKAINLLSEKIDNRLKSIQEAGNQVVAMLKTIESNIASVTDGNVANSAAIELIEEQLRNVADASNTLKNQLNAQQQAMIITEEQLEAINESRLQVNRRILDLQKMINNNTQTLRKKTISRASEATGSITQ